MAKKKTAKKVTKKTKPVIGIIMGSDSDYPKLEGAVSTLKDFGVEFEVLVASAHRTPDVVCKWAGGAEKRGMEVIIAAAGGAAHLAGVVAGHTILPVIGVPIGGTALSGLDSLLSMVQMPAGIPVATVAVGSAGGTNAALLALQILGRKKAAVAKKLKSHRTSMARKVAAKNRALQKKIDA